MFKWINSVRAIAVLIVLLTLSVALFSDKVSPSDYIVVANGVVLAYFGKRDEGTRKD